jgi:hypothetical protein
MLLHGWRTTRGSSSSATAGVTARSRRSRTAPRAPEAKHTLCSVDQLPWQPFDDQAIVQDVEEGELRQAWKELAAG